MSRITFLGGGSFGTALAVLLAEKIILLIYTTEINVLLMKLILKERMKSI